MSMIETIILYDANKLFTITPPQSPNSSIEVYDKLTFSILPQCIRIVAVKGNMRYIKYYNGAWFVDYKPEPDGQLPNDYLRGHEPQ